MLHFQNAYPVESGTAQADGSASWSRLAPPWARCVREPERTTVLRQPTGRKGPENVRRAHRGRARSLLTETDKHIARKGCARVPLTSDHGGLEGKGVRRKVPPREPNAVGDDDPRVREIAALRARLAALEAKIAVGEEMAQALASQTTNPHLGCASVHLFKTLLSRWRQAGQEADSSK